MKPTHASLSILCLASLLALSLGCKSGTDAEPGVVASGSGTFEPPSEHAEQAPSDQEAAGEAEARGGVPEVPGAGAQAPAAGAAALPTTPVAAVPSATLPTALAAQLPAGGDAYALIDVTSVLSQTATLAAGGDIEAQRALIREQVVALESTPDFPAKLRGRVHPERVESLAAAVYGASGDESWIVVTQLAVLDGAPAEGAPAVAINDELQVAVRGGQLVLGNGSVFEGLMTGTTPGGFDPASTWPEGWTQIPTGAAVAFLVPNVSAMGDAPPDFERMGLRRLVAAGGFRTETVFALDVDDDAQVRNFLGGAQAAASQRLAQLRPMAPPFLQGWVGYLELLDRAIWSQISLRRTGTVTSVVVAAPRCGTGSGYIYALGALGWLGSTDGNFGDRPFVPVEQRIAADCAPIPGPPANLPRRFVAMAGASVTGERGLALMDVGAFLRANLTTLFHVLPFALHPDDVTEALGATPLGLNGLGDPEGVVAFFMNINTDSAVLVLPPRTYGYLPIPVRPGMVQNVIEGVGNVIATSGMEASATATVDDSTPWARLEAAMPDNAVLGIILTSETADDILSDIRSQSAVLQNATLIGASLDADLGLAAVFFVGSQATRLAEATRADIQRFIDESTQDLDEREAGVVGTMISSVQEALLVEAVGDDVVRLRLGTTSAQSRSFAMAGVAAAVAVPALIRYSATAAALAPGAPALAPAAPVGQGKP